MRQFLSTLLLLKLMACGPVDESPIPSGALAESLQQTLVADNGLSANGLSTNGLAINGLVINGLVINGLALPEFRNWFDASPLLHEEVMRYIVRCAVPRGESRRFTSSATNVTYTWAGALGLALGWASGAPATLAEQQVVSACLAAHVNTYRRNVPVSLLGLKGNGAPIPIEDDELNRFDKSEACFFGNLFNGEGIYVGNDRTNLGNQESTPRRCALSPVLSGVDPVCPVVKRVGTCETLSCQMDPNSKYYTRCTYNGITYRPLTTRLRSAELYSCGDGVCQVSERCGTGSSPDSCRADCGRCR